MLTELQTNPHAGACRAAIDALRQPTRLGRLKALVQAIRDFADGKLDDLLTFRGDKSQHVYPCRVGAIIVEANAALRIIEGMEREKD